MATTKAGRITFTEEASQAAFGYLKGQSKWAELLAPGQFGTYGVKLYGDEVAEMKEELEALQASAAKEIEELGKKYTLADIYKTDEDGKQFLAFKLPEKDYEGNENKITFYDVSGKKQPDFDSLVGNGSTIKIKYRIAPYYMASTKMVGISFKFYAVQILDLKEYSGGDSGFSDETSGDAPFDTEGDDF